MIKIQEISSIDTQDGLKIITTDGNILFDFTGNKFPKGTIQKIEETLNSKLAEWGKGSSDRLMVKVHSINPVKITVALIRNVEGNLPINWWQSYQVAVV